VPFHLRPTASKHWAVLIPECHSLPLCTTLNLFSIPVAAREQVLWTFSQVLSNLSSPLSAPQKPEVRIAQHATCNFHRSVPDGLFQSSSQSSCKQYSPTVIARPILTSSFVCIPIPSAEPASVCRARCITLSLLQYL
jgi:hypothetical protein